MIVRRRASRRFDADGDGPPLGDVPLRSLIANSGDVIARLSFEGTVEAVSPSVERILGRQAPDLVGIELTELVHPADRTDYETRAIDRTASRSLEVRFRLPDGSYRWLWEIRSPILDEGGEIVAWTAVLRDTDALHRGRIVLERGLSDLAAAQHIARIGSWVWDPASDAVTWSDELFRIFGLAPRSDAPTFAVHQAMYTEETRPALLQAVARLIESGEPYEVALDLRRPGGELRHVIARGEAARTAEGGVGYLHGTLADVTDPRRAEAAVRASEARLRLLVENTVDIIFESTPDAVLSWLSPSVERVLGWTPAELVGRPVFEIIERDDRGLAMAKSAAANAGETASYEARFLCKDGTHRLLWVVASALPDADGRIVGRTGVARDIEAAAEARRAVEEARSELAEAQRIAGVGSWVRDPLTHRSSMSDQLYRLLGLDPVGTTPSMEAVEGLLSPVAYTDLVAGIDGVMRSGDPWEAEFDVHRADGSTLRVLIHVEAGSVPGALRGTVTDLTEVLARREARAARVAKRADYLARAEHALRTNISLVEGWAEMMADEGPMDEEMRRRGVSIIARNAHLLALQLRDLMSEAAESARAEVLELGPVDVAAVAAGVVAEYEGLRGAGNMTCDPDSGVVALGSPEALDKVVRQLVENAVRHAGADASIAVTTRRCPPASIELRVTDDGPGLPRDVDVFTPFTARGPAAGTGLGLHVVRTLVEAMNGSVLARNRSAGRGAEFLVTLEGVEHDPNRPVPPHP